MVIRWWQSLPQDVAVDKNSAMCTEGIRKLRLMRISRDIISKYNKRIWKEYEPTSFRAHTNCALTMRVCRASTWQQGSLSRWLGLFSLPGSPSHCHLPVPPSPAVACLTCSMCPGASSAQGTLLGVSSQPPGQGHCLQHISSRDVHSQW